MKMVVKSTILMFAVFGAVLMLSAAFVQPVSARASGQVSILQKYDYYISTTEKLGNDIEKDKTLMTLSERLSKNKNLNDILSKVKDAKSPDEIKTLTEKYANILKSTKEYKQIESIMKTRYGKQIRVLQDFLNKLQNKPDDGKRLFNALMEKYTESSVAPTSHVKSMDSTQVKVVISSGPRIGAATSSANVVRFSNSGNHPGNHAVSMHTTAKYQNGNWYVWVPGQGWFPGQWILYILGIIFAILGDIFWCIVIIIWIIIQCILHGCH